MGYEAAWRNIARPPYALNGAGETSDGRICEQLLGIRSRSLGSYFWPYGLSFPSSASPETADEIRGTLNGPSGRSAGVLTVWIILSGGDVPQFVTAFPGEMP